MISVDEAKPVRMTIASHASRIDHLLSGAIIKDSDLDEAVALMRQASAMLLRLQQTSLGLPLPKWGDRKRG